MAFSWGGEKGGNWDIYVKHISESEPHRLTTDPGLDRWPLWSPEGTRIMFRRGDAIYSMSALGGSERKLASGLPFPVTTTTGGEMSWSPDGKRLAIASQAGIFDVPAEGGELRAVATPAGALGRLLGTTAFRRPVRRTRPDHFRHAIVLFPGPGQRQRLSRSRAHPCSPPRRT